MESHLTNKETKKMIMQEFKNRQVIEHIPVKTMACEGSVFLGIIFMIVLFFIVG